MLRRHDLLRVDPPAWAAMLRGRPDLADEPLLADWAHRAWPVIVRRRLPGEDVTAIPAALPLPPSHGKRRITLRFPPDAGLTAVEPVLLRDAAPAAPAAWQGTIAALIARGGALGAAPRVFGALMWQHVTGRPYLTERSDLDLLWPVRTEPVALALVRTLLEAEAAGPVRLDGEFELPEGSGVHWRELAAPGNPGAPVLVKAIDGVELRPRASLFAVAAARR